MNLEINTHKIKKSKIYITYTMNYVVLALNWKSQVDRVASRIRFLQDSKIQLGTDLVPGDLRHSTSRRDTTNILLQEYPACMYRSMKESSRRISNPKSKFSVEKLGRKK